MKTRPQPGLTPFKWSGRMRESNSDHSWFPVELLLYCDDHNKMKAFASVRRDDDNEIPDGQYLFVDDLGERSWKVRNYKGQWQFGWRYRSAR
jgi:hypothetical protein